MRRQMEKQFKRGPHWKVVVNIHPFSMFTQLKIGLPQLCNEGVTSARFGDPDSVIYMRRINREGSYSARDLINVVKKYDCN